MDKLRVEGVDWIHMVYDGVRAVVNCNQLSSKEGRVFLDWLSVY
jgi:hypothetical protein